MLPRFISLGVERASATDKQTGGQPQASQRGSLRGMQYCGSWSTIAAVILPMVLRILRWIYCYSPLAPSPPPSRGATRLLPCCSNPGSPVKVAKHIEFPSETKKPMVRGDLEKREKALHVISQGIFPGNTYFSPQNHRSDHLYRAAPIRVTFPIKLQRGWVMGHFKPLPQATQSKAYTGSTDVDIAPFPQVPHQQRRVLLVRS